MPDGDTGTNLYLTFEAARQALVDAESTTLVGALTVFARGALLGARGNSGVILSQLMRAGADQLLRGDPTKPGQLLADTLTLAADAAYDAVAVPVEGTMLTVARAAADAAQASVPERPGGPGGTDGIRRPGGRDRRPRGAGAHARPARPCSPPPAWSTQAVAVSA